MSGVFPEQGSSAGGTQVTIFGRHLGGATAVHFGARPALSFSVVDDQTVRAVSPSGSGAVPVSVTTPGGTTTIGYFFYLLVPRLSRVAPGSGPLVGGNPVTLTGANLYTAESVHFGDATVLPAALTDQRLVVVAPAAAVPSTVPVYADAVGGVSNRLPYTYAAAPAIFSLSPASGPIAGGTTVVVRGTGLGGATRVAFGGFSAPSFRSNSDTLIVAVTPPGLTGPATVTVTTPGGSATLPGAFTFRADSETVVTSGPDPSVSGEPVVVTATVTGIPMTASTPTGTVTLEFGDGTPGVTAPLTGGTATVMHAYSGPSVSPYTVTATYDGDSDFYASAGTDTHTVVRAATTMTVAGVPDPAVFGEAVTLSAMVTVVPPGAGVPSGTVTFSVSGTGGGTFTGILDGTGATTVVVSTLGAGEHNVSATYDGDASFTGSTGTGAQTVNRSATTTTYTTPPNPSVTGETASAIAVVEAVSPGAGIPTGTVTFAVSGGESGDVALDATGTATASGILPAGLYYTTATYNGDADFTGSSESNIHAVEQASTTTTVVSSPDPSTFGEAVTVTATVAPVAPGAGVATGTVTYLIDGDGPVDVPLDGSGQASLVTSALAPGGHDITAVYGGDTEFTGSTGTGTQTVAQAGTTTTVTSGPDPSVFGQAVTFTAAVVPPGAGTPTGTVLFTIDGPGGGTFTSPLDAAGKAEVTTNALEADAHTVTAVYGGDASFTTSTGTSTRTVAQAATSTTVSSSPDPSAFGETVTLTAVVSPVAPGAGTPTGTVAFTVSGTGGGTLTGTVDASGVATASIDSLDFGTHTISAVYGGDGNFGGSTGAGSHSVVTQPSTTTGVTSSPSPSLYGETVTFTAIVAPVAPATGIPTGTVTFTVTGSGGGTLAGALDESGVATVSTDLLGAQVHSVTASYSGDATFDASSSSTTHTVAQAATSTVVLASPDPSVFGQQLVVTATVAPVAPGAGVPTGAVTFSVSGGETATVSLDAVGTAGFTTSTPVGTGDHTITAVYSGDIDFTTSTGTATQTVGQASTTTAVTSSPDPSTFGEQVTLTATVAPVTPGAGVPTGTVTFSSSSGGFRTVALNGAGIATFTTSVPFQAGTDTITATYNGDTGFVTSSGSTAQTVNQAATTTVISALGPSVFGESVPLTATVVPVLPGAGDLSGTLTFTIDGPGGGTLTAPVDSGGSASVAISTLAAGSHTITAAYSGDANFTTSTGTGSQTVGQAATTTRVAASPNPSVFGQQFTVTATVAALLPGAGVPTGTVTFTIDGVGPFDVAVDGSGRATFIDSDLAAGSHSFTAVYNGDGNFTGSTGTDTHTVVRAATTMTVAGVPDPAVFGEAVTLSAMVTVVPPGAGVPSGTVTFSVSGTGGGTFTGILDGTGATTVVVSTLGAGEHNVSATYDGDASFTGSTGTGAQTVNRSATTTTYTTPPNPSVTGETASAIAVVEAVSPGAGIPTGTVTFALSGGESGDVALDATGTATASGIFPVGVYLSTATYNGDTNFTGSSDSNTHTVEQASTTTTVASSPDPSRFGQPVTVTVTVAPVAPGTGTATGSVTVTIDGDGGGIFTAPVDATGRATVTISTLAAGSHSIAAVYSGDIGFAGSSGSHSHTVEQASTTTTVASSPDPSRFGQPVTFSARVTVDPPGAGVPTGTVTFTVGGTGGGILTAPVDTTGRATVTINTLTAGSHSVTAAYGGDDDFTGSTGTSTRTVAQAATSTTVSSSPDPSAFGETVTLTAVVSPVAPGAGTPTGTVAFTVSGTGGGTLTGTVDASGVATVTTGTLGFGAHTVTALYSGDANLTSSTGTTTHSVVTQPSTATTVIASPEPSGYGQPVTLTATVSALPPSTGTPTGTVTFTLSGTGGGSVPGTLDGSGVATVTTAILGAGTHSVTVTYHGDPTFAPSNGSTTHTVNQAATATTVTATPQPSAYGQQVTVSATVAPLTPGAATPTGTVSFSSSTGLNITVPLNTSGTATYTTQSPLQAGTETIIATYNGDTDFTTSTSTHTHTVNQATTTTTVTSSPDPSAFGQPVTLTATVAAVPPGAGAPTGTVTFTIDGPGGGTLAAMVAPGGTATVTTSTLAAGSHSVTAVYGGDANFASSTGTDTQMVNPSATTTTVTSAPDPSVVGQTVTLSAAVAVV
ncbi:Ig-like domain repeat protein, partial [Streptomyces sp. NPDC079020]|uniref:Ig-like domain repeat protein n=1 Tax=Streptomyces sp. NPDC079020 TaxID=3365722 RepID=UPI0037CD681C